MIESMTGFGRSQATFHGLDLSVEMLAVNRRNLELSVSLPRDWQPLERDIQNILRDHIQRGKVSVYVQASASAAEAGFHWDANGLESSLRRLGEVAYRHGIGWSPNAETLVRLAALNKVDTLLPGPEIVREGLLGQVEAALAGLLAMRATEGAALAGDLLERLGCMEAALAEIRKLSAGIVPRYREQLLQRLGQAGLELDLSDDRVLREIALFADKCDTSEEQTRLESHFSQFRECLAAGSPVGRKLEFIVQEINREFNTIGSKANNIELSRHVIEAKNEIERVREQIQNIE